MKMRAMTGAILAVFLLVFSCASARCELACETESMHTHPHSKQAQSHPAESGAMADMADMADCDGAAGMSAQDHGIQLIAKTACEHQVCQHESVVAQSEHTLKLTLFAAVYVATLPHLKLQLSAAPAPAFETPPLRGLTPLDQSSILRV